MVSVSDAWEEAKRRLAEQTPEDPQDTQAKATLAAFGYSQPYRVYDGEHSGQWCVDRVTAARTVNQQGHALYGWSFQELVQQALSEATAVASRLVGG